MPRVRIVIRYYDAAGELVFEDEPNLRHYYRLPAHWSRWEIYWDEILVQWGERAETKLATPPPEPPPPARDAEEP